ncbi:MAG: hypothetical protein AAFR01_04745 [Pseudomonadota bacterium]
MLMVAAPATLVLAWLLSRGAIGRRGVLMMTAVALWAVAVFGVVAGRMLSGLEDVAALAVIAALLGAAACLGFGMSVAPQPLATPPVNTPWSSWMIVGIFAFGALLRVTGRYQPLESDVGIWASIADLWLHGAPLYAGGWEHKPPMIILPFAIPLLIADDIEVGLFVFGMGVWALTTLGILFAATRLAGRAGAVVALLVWVVFGNDPLIEGNRIHGEGLVNLTVVWAFGLLLRPEGPRLYETVLAGLLFGIASLTKQHSVLIAAALALVFFLQAFRSPADERREALLKAVKTVATMAAMGALCWALTFAYAAYAGILDDFFYANFEYLRHYAAIDEAGDGYAFQLVTIQPNFLFPTLCGFTIAVGIFCMNLDSRKAFVLAFLVSTIVIAVLPLRFFPHYVQHFMPGVALAIGYIASRQTTARPLTTMIACLILLTPFVHIHSLAKPSQLSNLAHSQHFRTFPELREISLKIAEQEDKALYVYGMEANAYLYTNQLSMTRFVFPNPFETVNHPRREEWAAEALAVLQEKKPSFIIARNLLYFSSESDVKRWIDYNYKASPELGQWRNFTVLQRR